MTYREWENGKSLTIHNATKEQLQFMVKDKETYIEYLTKELEEEKSKTAFLTSELYKAMLKIA